MHPSICKEEVLFLENDDVFVTVGGTRRLVKSLDEYPDIITQRLY